MSYDSLTPIEKRNILVNGSALYIAIKRLCGITGYSKEYWEGVIFSQAVDTVCQQTDAEVALKVEEINRLESTLRQAANAEEN